MSGTQSFVIALSGLGVAVVSVLTTVRIARVTRLHERALARDDRFFEARRAAYVDVLTECRRQQFLLGQARRFVMGLPYETEGMRAYDRQAMLGIEAAAEAVSSTAFLDTWHTFREVVSRAWDLLPSQPDLWEQLSNDRREEILDPLDTFVAGLSEIHTELVSAASRDLSKFLVSGHHPGPHGDPSRMT